MTSTPQTPQTTQRMHLLDTLRFGAAMAVVLYHFTATPTASRYWGSDVTELFDGINHVTRYGWLAVEAFFIISGFAILWSIRGRTLAQFTGSRAGRLFPAFWACILVTAILQEFWTGGRQLTLGETLLNLTMVPDLLGAPMSQVVYWTLLVELKFYLLIGLMMLFGPLTPYRVLTLALAWPVTGIVLRFLDFPEVAEHFVVRHSPHIALGMLMFLLWQDVQNRRAGHEPTTRDRRRTIIVGVATVAMLALSVVRVVESAGRSSELQGVTVHPLVAVAVLFAIVAGVWYSVHPRAVVPWAWLGAACTVSGAITYPLYLVHTQFGWALTEAMVAAGAGVWLTLIAATVVSLLLAVVIHYGAERTFSPRLRRAVTGALTGPPKEPADVAPPADTTRPGGSPERATGPVKRERERVG